MAASQICYNVGPEGIQMSIFQSFALKIASRIGLRSVAYEVTQECNQDCAFCYNVWKCSDYPRGQQDTAKSLEIIDRIVKGYKPQVLTLTGGEPLLRPDILELVRHIPRRIKCALISNGTLMTDRLAAELVSAGVSTFEFTLLSADPDTHNALAGRESFAQLIEAIASVKAAGGNVATTFVAMRQNIDSWEETLELNVALGVSGILFNRFNIGGAGVNSGAKLIPTLDQLESALKIASDGAKRYGISISCGVPVPPCVLDRTKFPDVHFGDCPVGKWSAYPTVDPKGNVRTCNHSATIMGNLFKTDFQTIIDTKSYKTYGREVPPECVGCKHLKKCRGGCRAAAEVCGNPASIDPFVSLCNDAKGCGCNDK